MADRKQLMNNPGAFSVAEIAEAVRAGVVSVYELSKSGKLTPMMRRRIENELRNPAAAQPAPAPVPDFTPAPAGPVVAPMPEQPAYQQPSAPAQPVMPPQPVQPVQAVVQPVQPTYQPSTIAPSQPVVPAYEEPQPVQPVAPPPLPVAQEPQPQQPTYPQQPVAPSPTYPVQPPFPEPQPPVPRKLPRLLSFQGRETRTNYFLISLCVGIFCFMLMVILTAILDTYRVSGGEIAGAIACVVAVFFLYWIVWAAAVRRCHDMGRAGWFVLLSFIPVANIVVGLMLLFCGGDPGENEYGPNPR